jgi:hypothetical protein
MAHRHDAEKPLKDFDRGIGSFHRSLGAMRMAIDRSKLAPELEPAHDSDIRSPSVRIQRESPA